MPDTPPRCTSTRRTLITLHRPPQPNSCHDHSSHGHSLHQHSLHQRLLPICGCASRNIVTAVRSLHTRRAISPVSALPKPRQQIVALRSDTGPSITDSYNLPSEHQATIILIYNKPFHQLGRHHHTRRPKTKITICRSNVSALRRPKHQSTRHHDQSHAPQHQ